MMKPIILPDGNCADGNGYAITNDGNHLIRFTTGKKTVITDFGNLIDAETNKWYVCS